MTRLPRVCTLVALLLVVVAAGCAPYRFGNQSLYPCDIATVYVPMIESNSFRRGLGEQLTEAVAKEISLKTPFTVVSSAEEADSTLLARITADTKRIVVESPTDEGRELDVNLRISVSWTDHRGTPLRDPLVVPVPASVMNAPATVTPTDVAQSAFLVPETGQSVAVSQQKAIQRLAEQIVGLMESPW